ncbi:MAG: hypothetical protein C5B49_06415 [Bdellovibrio sp.]|nr:MAG: hypothetical protein C5B49_06415 [Bdellovibrio sp.]
MVFRIFLSAVLVCVPALAAQKWVGQIPKLAEKVESWHELLSALREAHLPFGSLVASGDILNFFGDLPSKELAYATIISLIDEGYPFSARPLFIPGDIEPGKDASYRQSYLLYKGIVNADKKMDKWAEHYFSKLDQENFPKYLFYLASEHYRKGEDAKAIELLRKALSLTKGAENAVFAKKVARNLARIYYELTQYEKSYEIYESFLLKTNPINPGDWLEGAWNLYRLRRYPEALGYLYNMEAKSSGPNVLLEKYVLRALIYREYCSVESTKALIDSFTQDFGRLINSIKTGEPLNRLPELGKLEHPQTLNYRQVIQTLDELARESQLIPQLPSKVQPLARYVYSSEIEHLKNDKQLLEENSLEILARHLVILGESLNFSGFNVALEKYSPERVFSEQAAAPVVLIDETEDNQKFRLHWIQTGDFWRDERLYYRGLLENRCDK